MVRILMLCLSLFAALVAWGGTDSAASSAAFELDLSAIKAGMSRTESCAVAFSGGFALDLRALAESAVADVAVGSSGAFVLDLTEITSADAGAVVAAFGNGFVLDLRNIKEDEPQPEPGGEGKPEGKSFGFVLDLREIEDADATAYAVAEGFELDLRTIADESAGGAASAVVWASSNGFELDLRDLDPETMGADVVFLYSNTFELDLRKITVEGVIILPKDITGGKAIPISEDWVNKELDEQFGAGTGEKFGKLYGYDLKTALTKPTGKYDAKDNELLVWHDYVAGTDPTDPDSVFQASVEMVGGVPVITWSPALNGDGVQEGKRTYRIFATNELGGEWVEVSPDETGNYSFFTVTVEMP